MNVRFLVYINLVLVILILIMKYSESGYGSGNYIKRRGGYGHGGYGHGGGGYGHGGYGHDGGYGHGGYGHEGGYGHGGHGYGGGYGGYGHGHGGHGGGYGGHGSGYGGQTHYHFYPVNKKKGIAAAAGGLLAGLATGLAAGLINLPLLAGLAAAGKKRSIPELLQFKITYGPALRKQLAEIEGEQQCTVALRICDLELAKLMNKDQQHRNDESSKIPLLSRWHISSTAIVPGGKGDAYDGGQSQLGYVMCSQLLPKCSGYYHNYTSLSSLHTINGGFKETSPLNVDYNSFLKSNEFTNSLNVTAMM